MDKVYKTAKDGRELVRENGKFIWRKPGESSGTETATESVNGSGAGMVREIRAGNARPVPKVGETYSGTETGTETGIGTETETETGRTRRKPGRPKGSGAQEKNVHLKLDAKLFATQLQGAHQLAALVLKNPGWALTDDESQSLAVAMLDVSKQYEFNINPRVVAWLKLATVSAMIYGPRVAFLMPAKKPKGGGQILPFAQPGAAPAQPGNAQFQTTAPTNGNGIEHEPVDIEWPPKTKLKLTT